MFIIATVEITRKGTYLSGIPMIGTCKVNSDVHIYRHKLLTECTKMFITYTIAPKSYTKYSCPEKSKHNTNLALGYIEPDGGKS